MKILPTVVNWFDRARACTRDDEAQSVYVRKLDAIYEFIHAIPDTFDVAPKWEQRMQSEIDG